MHWTLVFSAGFVDTGGVYLLRTNYGLDSSWIHFIRLPVLVLIGYSFYFLYDKASTRISLFVIALTGSSVILLLLPDLALGWQLSLHPRFLTPYYLGALLAVAYFLAAKTALLDVRKRRVWQAMTAIIIAAAILSCAISSRAETWWNKGVNNPHVARVINHTSRPLLIVGSEGPDLGNAVSLSNILDPKVRIRLLADSNRLGIPDDANDVFLIKPSQRMRQRLERGSYRIEAAYDNELWRLTKSRNLVDR
jgi:uncharacterized membrane protein